MDDRTRHHDMADMNRQDARHGNQSPVGESASTDEVHHHAGPQPQGGHGKHAGHHVEQFRRRFWWSLLLTIPVVVTSDMVIEWFGYELDFPAIESVGPVLGSV